MVTPSAAWTTYRDPNFGFSFQYPGNWHVDTHGPNAPVLPEGTYVAIRNFDLAMRKGPIPPDVLSIEVSLSAELAQYGSVNNWLARQKQNVAGYPEVRYSPEEYFTVAGAPAVQFTVTAPTVPQGNRLTVWGKGNRLYVLSAMPASSPYLSAVDGIVSSFQIP